MNFSPQPLDPKRDLGRFSVLTFVYSLVLIAITFVYTIFLFFIKFYENGMDEAKTEEAVQQLMASAGGPYILFSILGILIFAFYQRKQPAEAIQNPAKKKMTAKVFFFMLAFLWFTQLFGTLTNQYMNFILRLFGLQLPDSGLLDQSTTSLSMLFYAGFMAPISEELIFRGIGLTALGKYGKVFAIVLTAIMFGIFHENFSQLYFAAVVGLGLGYIALEYSLFWAIFFHMFNNLIIAEGLTYLEYVLPFGIVPIIRYLCMVAGTAVLILFLILKWPLIKAYIQANRSVPGTYRRALRSFWFWFFCLMGIGSAFLPILLLYLQSWIQRFS